MTGTVVVVAVGMAGTVVGAVAVAGPAGAVVVEVVEVVMMGVVPTVGAETEAAAAAGIWVDCCVAAMGICATPWAMATAETGGFGGWTEVGWD